MKKINKYEMKDSDTPIVSEPVVAYGSRNETDVCRNYASRNGMKAAIDGDELLNRLRPRIKSLFK